MPIWSMCPKKPRQTHCHCRGLHHHAGWNARHRAFSPREKRRRYRDCAPSPASWRRKKTSELIPLCPPVMLTNVTIDLLPIWGDDAPATEKQASHASGPHPCGIHVVAQASLVGKTGVEMGSAHGCFGLPALPSTTCARRSIAVWRSAKCASCIKKAARAVFGHRS